MTDSTLLNYGIGIIGGQVTSDRANSMNITTSMFGANTPAIKASDTYNVYVFCTKGSATGYLYVKNDTDYIISTTSGRVRIQTTSGSTAPSYATYSFKNLDMIPPRAERQLQFSSSGPITTTYKYPVNLYDFGFDLYGLRKK